MNNIDPKISVVIPVYNRSKSLECAVKSVLNQSFSNFELILVDDCSLDNSWEIMNSFEDRRVRCFQLKTNSGASKARNFGIQKSNAAYISFLDSDDFYEPDFLLETLNVLEPTSEEIGFMWTGVRYIENGLKNEFSWSPKLLKTPYLTFLNSLHIGTNSGITVKRKVFDQCGNFDSNLPAAEDTEFFLRITKMFNFTSTNKILINIERDGKDRLSKNFVKIAEAYNKFLKSHLVTINDNSLLKTKFYYKMMWLNYQAKNKKLARYYFKNIPKSKIATPNKYFLIFLIYELFSLELATKMHFRLAAKPWLLH